jgi:hypothetical protein
MTVPTISLSDLIERPQWVAWRNEKRINKGRERLTKVPYAAPGVKAESDNPSMWLPHDRAAAVAEAIVNGLGGGIGIMIGRCAAGATENLPFTHFWRSQEKDYPCTPTGLEDRAADGRIYAEVKTPRYDSEHQDEVHVHFVPKDELVAARGEYWIVGIDLDTCRDPATGQIEPWAQAVIDRIPTYAEISPSQTGVKLYALIDPADEPALRRIMGGRMGRSFKRANSTEHPPAIEVYTGGRYFAVTWAALPEQPAELSLVPLETWRWLIEEAGPALSGKKEKNDNPGKPKDGRGSERGGKTAILARLDLAARRDRRLATAIRNAATMSGGSRSEGAMGIGAALRRIGWSFADMIAALLACPATKEWAEEQRASEDERQFYRIWERSTAPPLEAPQPEPDPDDDPYDGLAAALSASSWLQRTTLPVTRLLGDLITTTTRAFIVGRTGLGKTLLGLAFAVGMACGTGFLHWRSSRPARVIYIDGEMPAELLIQRIADAAERVGHPDLVENLMVFSLEDAEAIAERWPMLGMFESLNTEEGQNFIKRLCTALRPDVIIFDNVQALLTGVQKEEETWIPVLPLVQWLTKQRVGQLWFDHTGHNSDRQYGTAVKAWRFDLVGILTPLPEGEREPQETAFTLSFDHPGKARRRTPQNWAEFAAQIIRLRDGQWTGEPADSEQATRKRLRGKVKPSARLFHDALLNAIVAAATGPGQTAMFAWETECVRKGLIDPSEPGDDATLRARKRAKFRAAKSDLLAAGMIGINGERVSDLTQPY